MDLEEDFREFLELLTVNNVRFLIVGGFALAAHGLPRATDDIDIWVWMEDDNARALKRALDDFGFSSLEIDQADFLRPDLTIQLGYSPDRIDLMTSISGVDFEEAWERRIIATLDGVNFPVIGKADLVANKWALGRPQDLVDLMKLVHQAQRE
ncbi:MAG: DUF6036 family nucleotidyltransferase [Actinomycetota bacterium]